MSSGLSMRALESVGRERLEWDLSMEGLTLLYRRCEVDLLMSSGSPMRALFHGEGRWVGPLDSKLIVTFGHDEVPLRLLGSDALLLSARDEDHASMKWCFDAGSDHNIIGSEVVLPVS